MKCNYLIISILAFFTHCKTASDVPADTVNSLATIVSDMQLAHEGAPQGVPESYDWAKFPRVGMGNNPGTFRALIPWGQLYELASGNPAQNTRVQIRRLRIYILSKKTQQWQSPFYSEVIGGADFAEDFVNNVNRPADIRVPAEGGGITVKAGGGYNFHFWAEKRASIDPADIAGVFATAQARLVVENLSLPDDRAQAKYLLSIGADYWLNESAQWDNFKTNGDVGIGRFKFVSPNWQAFNMTSLNESELRKNPPPLE
jgi:hypothetical protein